MSRILSYIFDVVFVVIIITQMSSAEFKELLEYYNNYTQAEESRPVFVEEVSEDFSGDFRNEVSSCSLNGKLRYGANIRSVYQIDYLATNLLGLFGQPVEVDLNGTEKAILTFEVNKNNMHNVPMRNLIVLYYNEEKSSFDTVESATKGYDISVENTKSGIYLLADCYIWYSVWDADVSEYAYDAEYVNSKYNFAVVIPSEVKYYTVSDAFEPIDRSNPNSGSKNEILMFRSYASDKDICFTFDLYIKKDGIKEALDYFKAMKPELDAHGYGTLTKAEIEKLDIGNGLSGYVVSYEAMGDSHQKNFIGYYEYSENSYFIVSYIVFDKNNELYEKAIASLKSFKYN